MNLQTRLRALEAARRRAEAHPSPAAVVVMLAGDGALDPATLAQAEAWAKLPMRERRQLAPWGIRLFECDPALPDTDPHSWRGKGGAS